MNYGISILFRAIPLAMALFCFGYGAFIYGYGDAGNRVIAGPVVFSLGMICIALFCTAATIIRQIIHTYNETTKYILPIVGYLAALITVISGICIFSNATSPSAFVAGHVITGVGFITACVATAATSSTRFSLIPENSKATGNEVPQGAFSVGQRRAMIILAIVISIIAWVWAFVLLGNSHSHPAYFVAGHVMVGLACICTSLIALVATIARQVRNDYSEKERNKWPKLVLLMGSISFVWGLFVILADSGSANGTTGYIMLGLGLVCYSISSKVILLAKIWRRETSQPHPYDSGINSIDLFIPGCFRIRTRYRTCRLFHSGTCSSRIRGYLLHTIFYR